VPKLLPLITCNPKTDAALTSIFELRFSLKLGAASFLSATLVGP